jgi:hypothetical protein
MVEHFLSLHEALGLKKKNKKAKVKRLSPEPSTLHEEAKNIRKQTRLCAGGSCLES